MKLLIRKLLNKAGYDLVKKNYVFKPGKYDKVSLALEYKWLSDYNFRTIIDIGANEGQFSDKIRTLFPNALIYAFEPLPEAFSRLQKNFDTDTRLRAFNIALGESEGEIRFYENQYSQSSSALEPGEGLAKNFSFAKEVKEINVQVDTLDRVLQSEKTELPLLVKVDVQGYEDHVLKGGIRTLKEASVILCEVSFVELYKGQKLFSDIFEFLNQLGFNYAGSLEQIRSVETNRVLQADAIFIRSHA